MPRQTPIGALLRGVVAAALGIAAMDALWYSRYKRDGGQSGPLEWEFSIGLDKWENASTPGQIGKRLFEGLFQRELPPTWAALTTSVVHWGYGLGWGALYGLLAGSTRQPRGRWGLLFGPVVWSTGYIMLPPTGLYKPIWEYDAPTLYKDLSAHLVYGVTTATSFRLLST